MLEMLGAIVVAFFISGAIAPKIIPFLRHLKFGQQILEDGPTWHMKKQGTPTMGGIIFIIAIVATTFIFVRDIKAILALMMALFFGFIGFIDDYTKVVKKRNKGLTARQKLILQILVSVAYVASLKIAGVIDTSIYIPFFNVFYELSWLYYPFAVFAVVATVNAVNLTDGLDGLATSVTVVIAIFFGAIAFITSEMGLGLLSGALVGSLFGFLIYNAYPAKVFMGDTGSLFLGGLVCSLAFAYNLPMLIAIVGLIYVCEALSVIIQVISFKLTKKRVFKMAPLHHHFEMCGWSEKKVVMVFTIATMLMCVIGFMVVMNYYYL